jgi:NCAIR mutase (PurE)-related protein
LDADIMRALLEGVRAGTVTPDAAVAAMRNLPFEELGFAKVDHHRAVRKGFRKLFSARAKLRSGR